MAVIPPQFHHCDCEMCEWLNFGTFFKFPCIVWIYAWFFMHCRNHHSDSHANHVIIWANRVQLGSSFCTLAMKAWAIIWTYWLLSLTHAHPYIVIISIMATHYRHTTGIHYCDVIMARYRLKSPAWRLFTQPFIQTQIKENIKAPRHWPLCGEFTGDWWIPEQMARNAKNVSIWLRHHEAHPLNRSCGGPVYARHRRACGFLSS